MKIHQACVLALAGSLGIVSAFAPTRTGVVSRMERGALDWLVRLVAVAVVVVVVLTPVLFFARPSLLSITLRDNNCLYIGSNGCS
jgi:hypothetical protein